MAGNIMVSVIIPVYNGEKYIESIVDQFDRQADNGFELIFVNDGSTDNTCPLIENEINNRNFTVRLYSQPNKGVSAARNAGINLAQGEYITFVDVDDAVAPDYLETINNCVKNPDQSFDLLVFEQNSINEDEQITKQPAKGDILPIEKEKLIEQFLHNPTAMGVYNLIVRRTWLLNTGILFKEGYKYYEDYDFLVRTFSLAESISILPKVLYFYVQRADSVMRKFNSDRIKCLSLMEELEKWLESTVPAVANTYKKWGVSRIYWSALWQACKALQDNKDFLIFAEKTHAKQRLKKLLDYPDKRVRLSSRVFIISPRIYLILIKLINRNRMDYEHTSLEQLSDIL